MKRSVTVAILAVFSLAVLAASALGGAGDDQELRSLTRKVERTEKDVRDLSKTVRDLSRAVRDLEESLSAVCKVVESLDERSDKRTLLLGRWFDAYHAKSNGQYHQQAVRRIR